MIPPPPPPQNQTSDQSVGSLSALTGNVGQYFGGYNAYFNWKNGTTQNMFSKISSGVTIRNTINLILSEIS